MNILFLIFTLFLCFVGTKQYSLAIQKKDLDPTMERNNVVMFSGLEDSPAVAQVGYNCPENLTMDINGDCREVWFEEYSDKSVSSL